MAPRRASSTWRLHGLGWSGATIISSASPTIRSFSIGHSVMLATRMYSPFAVTLPQFRHIGRNVARFIARVRPAQGHQSRRSALANTCCLRKQNKRLDAENEHLVEMVRL